MYTFTCILHSQNKNACKWAGVRNQRVGPCSLSTVHENCVDIFRDIRFARIASISRIASILIWDDLWHNPTSPSTVCPLFLFYVFYDNAHTFLIRIYHSFLVFSTLLPKFFFNEMETFMWKTSSGLPFHRIALLQILLGDVILMYLFRTFSPTTFVH